MADSGRSDWRETMTAERHMHLDRSGDPLTAQELANGWHYCPDWDFLLVNSNDDEGEGCGCTCKER